MVRKGRNSSFDPVFREIKLSENCDYEIAISCSNMTWKFLKPRINFNRTAHFEKRALECQKLGKELCPRTIQEMMYKRPYFIISYDDIQKGVYKGKRYWEWKRKQARLLEQQKQDDIKNKDKDPWQRMGIKLEDLEFETPPKMRGMEVEKKAVKQPLKRATLETVVELSDERESTEKKKDSISHQKAGEKEEEGTDHLDAFFKLVRDSMKEGEVLASPKPSSTSTPPVENGLVTPLKHGLTIPLKHNDENVSQFRDSMKAMNVGSCPICLYDDHQFTSKLVSCGHKLCTRCAEGWSQIENKCPLCKMLFNEIEEYDDGRLVEVKRVSDRKQVYKPIETTEDRIIRQADKACYMCNKTTKRNYLLICDFCLTKTCHTECLDPPLTYVPQDQWFCDFCVQSHNLETKNPIANYFAKKKQKRDVTRKRNLETNASDNKRGDRERAKTRRPKKEPQEAQNRVNKSKPNLRRVN